MTALRQSCLPSGSAHITIPANGTFHSAHSPVYSRLASENSSIRKALRCSFWVCGLARDEQTGMRAYSPPQDGSSVIVVSDFFPLEMRPIERVKCIRLSSATRHGRVRRPGWEGGLTSGCWRPEAKRLQEARYHHSCKCPIQQVFLVCALSSSSGS